MGRIFRVYLDGHVYSCNYCQTHLSLASTLLSKNFQCNHGRAYLFDKAVNVTLGEKEDRFMMTGLHTVADIFCVGCSSLVGWKYVAAFEKSQKYKEGRFILERYKVLGPDGNTYAVAQEVAGSDDEDP